MSTLGERLKHLRERTELTQLRVSKMLGISNAQLSRYESDIHKPDPDTLAKLAELYGVTTDYLIRGTLSKAKELVSEYIAGQAKQELKDIDERHISSEEREFLDWVKEHVTGQFFYDFHQSQDKEAYMRSLKLIYEMEKGRKPGQKQGE